MSVRPVVTRRSRNVRGYMPSFKLRAPVAWESQNELILLRIAELSGDVRRFEVQPSIERILVAGQEQIYYPDLELTYLNGRTVTIEVKPAHRLNTPKVAGRMAAFAAQCKAEGREFHVITDVMLAREPRRSNVEELMYHRRWMNRAQQFEVKARVDAHQPQTIGELRRLLGQEQADVALGNGLVGINLDEPMEDETVIRLQGGHFHAALHD